MVRRASTTTAAGSESTLVRFCDDFVMCFTHKADADRVLAVLAKRLGKFELHLHPDKTRLVDFRPRRSTREQDSTLPTTFNFLGFTHVWGKSRKGNAVGAAADGERSTLRVRSGRSINDASGCGIGHSRAAPTTMLVLKGHYAYFGITGNFKPGSVAPSGAKALAEVVVASVLEELCAMGTVYANAGRFALPPPRIVHAYAVG